MLQEGVFYGLRTGGGAGNLALLPFVDKRFTGRGNAGIVSLF